jgi:hypothetical protein
MITDKKFYATLCLGDGGGYVTIHAKDREEARNKMFSSIYGERWAFMYTEEEKANCIDKWNQQEKGVIL